MKLVIQVAFDVEYTCVFEHMVYVSNSPNARIDILGIDFLARFGKFINLRNQKVILTVFLGKCTKLTPYLDKTFPYRSQVNSEELSQLLTTAPFSRFDFKGERGKQEFVEERNKLSFT